MSVAQIATLVAAAATSGFLAWLFIRGAAWQWRWLPIDRPNARSMHTVHVPRAGGIAVFLAITVFCGGALATIEGLVPALIALVTVSFIDDRHGLSPALRLVVQVVAAVWFTSGFGLPWWFAVVITLSLVALSNMVNFMDGINGMIGGTLAITTLYLGIAGWNVAATSLATISLTIFAALCGFLVFNLPGGKIFLGDVGSVGLGFLVGAIAWTGVQTGVWPGILPSMVLLPLLTDAVLTLFHRALRREHIWLPHREHLYQRLVQCGMSHGQVTAIYGVATAICGGIGLLSSRVTHESGLIALICTAGILAAAYWTGLRFAANRLR